MNGDSHRVLSDLYKQAVLKSLPLLGSKGCQDFSCSMPIHKLWHNRHCGTRIKRLARKICILVFNFVSALTHQNKLHNLHVTLLFKSIPVLLQSVLRVYDYIKAYEKLLKIKEALDLGHSKWHSRFWFYSWISISLFLLCRMIMWYKISVIMIFSFAKQWWHNEEKKPPACMQLECITWSGLTVCQSMLILYQHYINSSHNGSTISTQWLHHDQVGCGFWLCCSYMKCTRFASLRVLIK